MDKNTIDRGFRKGESYSIFIDKKSESKWSCIMKKKGEPIRRERSGRMRRIREQLGMTQDEFGI